MIVSVVKVCKQRLQSASASVEFVPRPPTEALPWTLLGTHHTLPGTHYLLTFALPFPYQLSKNTSKPTCSDSRDLKPLAPLHPRTLLRCTNVALLLYYNSHAPRWFRVCPRERERRGGRARNDGGRKEGKMDTPNFGNVSAPLVATSGQNGSQFGKSSKCLK